MNQAYRIVSLDAVKLILNNFDWNIYLAAKSKLANAVLKAFAFNANALN
jgi:hypothetical protein